jgi:hypothetical protein
VLNTNASRSTGTSIAGLVIGVMGLLVFTVALYQWLGERIAWRITGGPSGRQPIAPIQAAQVVFCLEELEELLTTKPEHAWLWRLRAKVVSFTVSSYGLRDLAKAHVLTKEEKAEIARTDGLLRPPAGHDVSTESDEAKRVHAELLRRLEGLTTWGVGARPSDRTGAAGDSEGREQ